MAKRRTRKGKEKPKHPFLVTWDQPVKKTPSGDLVKRQFKKGKTGRHKKKEIAKKTNLLDKDAFLALAKRDILKSLILASLILGLEMVLYFTWYG